MALIITGDTAGLKVRAILRRQLGEWLHEEVMAVVVVAQPLDFRSSDRWSSMLRELDRWPRTCSPDRSPRAPEGCVKHDRR